MVFKDWLQALGKFDYVQGRNRPDIDCILCGVRDNDKRVKILKIYYDDIIFVSLNLYPYNPGHLMVIPNRHVKKFIELNKTEISRINRVIQGLQLMLNNLYNPTGYNIGMNEGKIAGGSINHLHFHLVPRYGAELGFIDIIGKTRVVPLGLKQVKKDLQENVYKYINKEFLEKFK